MKIQRAPMPNDTAIVDPNSGRLSQAWVHYLGQLDRISQVLAKIEDILEVESDATDSQVRNKLNEIIRALNGE